jgi:hypothetical protein
MIVKSPPVGVDILLSGLDVVFYDNCRRSLYLPAHFLQKRIENVESSLRL